MALLRTESLDQILERLASEAPPGAFVEVGVYRGGSARRLWRVAQAQGRALFMLRDAYGRFADARGRKPKAERHRNDREMFDKFTVHHDE